MRNLVKKIISSALLTFFLCSCAATSLESGAARVVVSPQVAPKVCKFKGTVVGNQGNSFTGGFTTNRNLEEGAMNDIKNRAFKLGANYVYLIVNRAGLTGTMQSNSYNSNAALMSGSSVHQTNVTNLGAAYACPPHLIGLE